MITEYKKVVKLLTKREKRRLYFLTIIKIFSGIMDTLGVASIAPFLAVLSKPEILDNNVIILRLKEIFDLNNQSIIFCFAFGSLFIIIINQFVRLLNSWYEKYAIKNIWWSFHCKLFKFYLTRPYSFHIQTNSKNLLEKLQVETSLAVDGTIASIYQILGNIATCVFLFFFLLVIYPIVSIVIFFAAGASYWLIFSRLKKKINEYAEFQPLFAEKTFVLIDRAFQSIKDIIIKNNHTFYLNLLTPLSKKYAKTNINYNAILIAPKAIVETLAYVLLLSVTFYFLSISANFSSLVIILALYAFALQRILPAVQGIYQAISLYKFSLPSLDRIYKDLLSAKEEFEEKNKFIEKKKKFNFSDKIELLNVEFKYPNSKETALRIKHFEIKPGSFIGIAGKTGSGKTTLVDLMLGLLTPNSGKIMIDGNILNDELTKLWQTQLGYAPQFPFMADDTIKNNITLGEDTDHLDIEKIREVAKIAQIDEFIENNLPKKYDTIIGENGIKLSGGQRQRLSIARALFKDPDIIFFDEATNSLDVLTEKSIIESVIKYKKNKTLIMITHRLPTLQNCDEILMINKGTLVDRGSYDFLKKNNQTFFELEKEI